MHCKISEKRVSFSGYVNYYTVRTSCNGAGGRTVQANIRLINELSCKCHIPALYIRTLCVMASIELEITDGAMPWLVMI